VLEIEFADGSKMVINRHGAAREIWVAARSRWFPLPLDGSAWRDTRDGTNCSPHCRRSFRRRAARRCCCALGRREMGISNGFGGSIGAGGCSTSGGGTASW